jgi:hypothetical protein
VGILLTFEIGCRNVYIVAPATKNGMKFKKHSQKFKKHSQKGVYKSLSRPSQHQLVCVS